MNFKDLLKRNDYNTHSVIIFSIQTLIFLRYRERGEEREREREERGDRETKRREGDIYRERGEGERETRRGEIEDIVKF